MEDTEPMGSRTLLGGFEIEKELGKGGMGVVYKAHELSLNRKVALKILSQKLSSNEEFVKRFKREAQIVAALNHPNIVNILTYGEENGQQYFAMEYIKGKDLGQILNEKKVLPVQEALTVAAQVASALGEASERGVIHRDLKPANIMIDESGSVKVTDFGVAHYEYADSKLTRTGLFMGTPEYSSPEQVMGQPLDVRSDIYSLGAMLFRMLSGDPPVTAESPMAVVAKIVNESLPPVDQMNPSLPKPVSRLINKMVARDPKQRFQHPNEIIAAIDACRKELNLDVPPDKNMAVGAGPMHRPPAPKPSKGKKIGGIIGIALAVLLLVWIVDSAIKPSNVSPPEPTREPVPAQPIDADQLLVKGRFVTGPQVDPPTALAGGVIRSNINDKTISSATGIFQFKNTKPLLPDEKLLISAVFYGEDKRIFHVQGGTFQKALENATQLDCGDIPLEPYTFTIDNIPVNVSDWNGKRVTGEKARVKIGDQETFWSGESFVGSWTFTTQNETVAIEAAYDTPDGKTVRGRANLSINKFDLLAPSPTVTPIQVALQKPAPQPVTAPPPIKAKIRKTPIVFIVVSADDTMRPFVQANIESNLMETGLKVSSASEIPVLYKKIQLGQTPINFYKLKQLIPKGKADILLLAEIRKTGSMDLEYYGTTDKLISANYSLRAVDMMSGVSAASPATGAVKYTSLNMEQNITEALTPGISQMGPSIKAYWQDKNE